VRKAVERWEVGAQFGAEAGEDRELEWAWGDDGGVYIRETEKGEAEGMRLRVDGEGIVRWLNEVGRKELSGALFLRWLDEVQMLRGVEGFETAKKYVIFADTCDTKRQAG
jgi:hypothetical protein